MYDDSNIQVSDKLSMFITRYYHQRRLLHSFVWSSSFPFLVHNISEIGYGRCVTRRRVLCWFASLLLSHCLRYLSDTSNREIYESAHSVILAILTSHTPPANSEIKGVSDLKSELSDDFVMCVIPFYAQCLIEVSKFFLFLANEADPSLSLVS